MKNKIIIITAIFIPSLLLMFTQGTQKNLKSSMTKWSHFECGFLKMGYPSIPFSFQFFLVSLLFLIFDMEITLLLSYPLEILSTKKTFLISTILLILTLGLLYEWQKSKIDWSKWMSNDPFASAHSFPNLNL